MATKARALLIPLLVAAGTTALLLLIIVLVTGGFVIDADPLHFSSRQPAAPLLIAFVAWTAAALIGRRDVLVAAASVFTFIERHALALALVIASAVAGVGVAYGTHSASGADASGYVSQSELIASGRLVRDEPLARQVAWPDATWVFSPLGYRPGPNAGEIVPTYPAGLPAIMAAARVVLGPTGPFFVVPLLGALAVLCTYALGARLHSRAAGVIAAALLATSPILLFQIVQPMSDVPATALWALALLFALSPLPGSALAAGGVSGFALLIRPNLVLLAIPVALVSRRWAFLGIGHVARVAAGMLPAAGALFLLQWRLLGSPLASGYGSLQDLFELANVVPNLRGYGLRLLSGEAPVLCLAVASLAVLVLTGRSFRLKPEATTTKPEATTTKPEATTTKPDATTTKPAASPAKPEVTTPTLVAALFAAAVLVSYMPYGVFAEWSYLRFLLPALPLTFVLVASLLVHAARALPAPVRGVVVLIAVVTACSANINVAAREQAFNLWRYESRYRTAGMYLDATLPANAVVLAVQQSGSVAHYARTPVVRWDMLRVDLDAAVDALRALGRHPVVLVEDWEAPELPARFPASAIARLDWMPRADFGTETRVRLFDPADRGNSSHHRTTDRLP